MCSQGDLALSDLTLAYRQLQVPFSCHSEVYVMVIFLDLASEHKATASLQHLCGILSSCPCQADGRIGGCGDWPDLCK